MGLTYKILWVDDDIENYEQIGQLDNINSYLLELGFQPAIDAVEEIKDVWENLKSKKYDLILSDYDISDEADGSGDKLIERIREGEIYTEILFYSNKADFNTVAQNLYQDRISFLSLIGQDEFELERKTKQLIDLTLNKLQEIESLRGLVMSETSILDALVMDILSAYFQSTSNHKSELRANILEKIEGSLKGNLRKNGELKLASKTDLEIVQSRLFDSSKMVRAVKDVIEYEQIHIEDGRYTDFFDNYKQDVLDLRNNLAHAKSTFDDNGEEYLVISRPNGQQNIRFDRNRAINIRRNLLKYHDLLSGLHKKIEEL